ncbi:MAG: tRNA (guanosine(46)-N7)-methyltransferase TrmB [Maricaulaceae bacterium]|nr:tRNA (guanosine(46)-N7)-methyltransferase TrmB [Maricaulaceae bacterium]
MNAPAALRTYGRTKGRPLSARKQALVDTRLPQLAVPAEGALDPAALVPGKDGYVLEIGFGGGEHLAAQAQARPGLGFIGAEPFLNGVASALGHVEDAGLSNVRLHHGDARDLLARLAPASLDTVYLLFPDPWPKTRHAKRRFVQPETLDALARALKPGGLLRIATDVKAYADHVMIALNGRADFRWAAQTADDWRNPPAGHVTTRYERKRLGDCAPVFLDFRRV